MIIDNVRIVPHKPPFSDAAWFRVQVKTRLLEIGRLRVFMWRTVGDCPSFSSAYACACDIRSAVNFNIANGKE